MPVTFRLMSFTSQKTDIFCKITSLSSEVMVSLSTVFRNGSKVIQKMYERKEAFKGISYHIINSSFEAFCRLPLYMSLTSGLNLTSMGILYSTEVILYPLNTAFRRITCQQPGIPGMIPLRYSGVFHALRLIRS